MSRFPANSHKTSLVLPARGLWFGKGDLWPATIFIPCNKTFFHGVSGLGRAGTRGRSATRTCAVGLAMCLPSPAWLPRSVSARILVIFQLSTPGRKGKTQPHGSKSKHTPLSQEHEQFPTGEESWNRAAVALRDGGRWMGNQAEQCTWGSLRPSFLLTANSQKWSPGENAELRGNPSVRMRHKSGDRRRADLLPSPLLQMVQRRH